MKFFTFGSKDIGIDLGTANIVMAVNGKGVVLNEPSVIAVNKRTNKILAVGKKAYRMVGKSPEYISVIRPLSCGVISDDEMTQCLIREFVRKASGYRLIKPRIVICVPSFITDVESRAVVEAAMNAGSRKVYLIQEPIAAILGAGINMSKARGHLVVDIGGGTTDVAVVSMISMPFFCNCASGFSTNGCAKTNFASGKYFSVRLTILSK